MMEDKDNPGADRGGDFSRERPSGRGPREGGRRGGGRRPGGPGGGRRFFRRRKVCRFCKENMDHIDYKDVKIIGQFIGDRGKVLPRRATGVCAPHQRQLKVALKRARNIALLPFAAVV
jgi:small subunit ribosomal protein S18